MDVTPRVGQLDETIEDLRRILPVTQAILSELLRASAPPVNLDAIENFLWTARKLEAHGEPEVINELLGQAEAGVQSLRQWLALTDLAISPYVLRTYVERNPPEAAVQKAWIRYFLEKTPHAESDRDKLDYLLTAYFSLVRDNDVVPRFATPAELTEAIAGLSARPAAALDPMAEVMLHELESLIARVADYEDFDQLVAARMVERARALKTNLGEHFYHTRALPTIVRFNIAFRRHFEQLFRHQVRGVKEEARGLIAKARQLYPAIQTAFQKLPVPAGPRAGGVGAGAGREAAAARVGRPLEVVGERAPIDQLVRRPEEAQKESELKGIIKRIGRHLQGLTTEQATAGVINFPLRHTAVELYEWEREAFAPTAESDAPVSAGAIQFSVGLIAWMEEVYVLYQKTSTDRYQWKPHFDFLSYAVARTHEQLQSIHGTLAGGPPEEAAWFAALLNTAQRLVQVLEKIAPVFG